MQRISTYTKGRIFDDSFAIEDTNDMFLGETGATIKKTIGDTQEPTAIELWLFDKEDFVRTLTKLLVSEHAYNDPVIRAELEREVENPATDIILVQPGVAVTLETDHILVQAKVAEFSYGTGALPPNSFFDALTLQMQGWEKAGAGAPGPKAAPPPMPMPAGSKPLDAYEIGPPPQMPSGAPSPQPPSPPASGESAAARRIRNWATATNAYRRDSTACGFTGAADSTASISRQNRRLTTMMTHLVEQATLPQLAIS